jgi:OFA family oxalate/formate antiporter-like MFS transporter
VRRGALLGIGFALMSFNSLYQYTWNVLAPLLQSGLRAGLIQVETAFTLFTVLSTLSQIAGGYWADVRGPREVGLISSLLSALGFLGGSLSPDLGWFYLFWSMGSVGEGVLYGIASNAAVKWFPERRGLATGLVSMGFGLGASIVNPLLFPFSDFRRPMLYIGIAELLSLPLLVSLVDYPRGRVGGLHPGEVIRTRRWWLLFSSYVLVTTPLVTLSSSLSLMGLPKGELEPLVALFPLLSGVGRPLMGYVSDRIGRVRAALLVSGLMVLGSAFLFLNVLTSTIVVGLFGGSVVSLYFALTADLFGSKYSTYNNALLYAGKAITGVLGGVFFGSLILYGVGYGYSFLILSTSISVVILLLLFRSSE